MLELKQFFYVKIFQNNSVTNVWFMSFGRVFNVEIGVNVKYLLLLSFLTVAEFYNLGHIQGIIRAP